MPLTPFNIAGSIENVADFCVGSPNFTSAIARQVLNKRIGALGFSYANRLWYGIGLGVWTWAVANPMNLALTGMATGTAGGGVILPVTASINLPPILIAIPIMRAALAGAGINGVTANGLAVSVATGICKAFSQHAGYTAPVALGSGKDFSKITVVNVATLIPILMSTIAGILLGAGPALPMLAVGLSVGIGGILLLGTGSATVVGAPAVPPLPLTVPTFSMVV